MSRKEYVDKCRNNIEAEIWAFTVSKLEDHDKLAKFAMCIREEKPTHRATVREITERPTDLLPEAYGDPQHFHNTACICLRRLGICRWHENEKELVIHLGSEIQGASTIENTPIKETDTNGQVRSHCEVVDMGFVGSYMKDMKACILAQ